MADVGQAQAHSTAHTQAAATPLREDPGRGASVMWLWVERPEEQRQQGREGPSSRRQQRPRPGQPTHVQEGPGPDQAPTAGLLWGPQRSQEFRNHQQVEGAHKEEVMNVEGEPVTALWKT